MGIGMDVTGTTIVVLGLLGSPVPAAGETGTLDPTTCPVVDYDTVTLQLDAEIPDIGTLGPLGPIQFPLDGATITDAIMEMDIAHTWVGNLVVTITYDLNCDGENVVGPVRLLCRQGLDGCPEEYACCGCSADLLAGEPYVFSDDGAKEMTNTAEQCTGQVAHGCYRPASESEFELRVFDGQPTDGCWYMTIFDGAGGDVGTIYSWTIHLRSTMATPTDGASWGAIKARYRD